MFTGKVRQSAHCFAGTMFSIPSQNWVISLQANRLNITIATWRVLAKRRCAHFQPVFALITARHLDFDLTAFDTKPRLKHGQARFFLPVLQSNTEHVLPSGSEPRTSILARFKPRTKNT